MEVPGVGFAVEPKLDCEHLARYTPIPDSLVSRASEVLAAPCAEEDCASTAENWLCLACGGVYCARYVNEHMVSHNEMTRLDDVDAPGGAPTGHCVCISFSDLSVWCYACDSYIKHDSLRPMLLALHDAKFGDTSRSDAATSRPGGLDVVGEAGEEEEEGAAGAAASERE